MSLEPTTVSKSEQRRERLKTSWKANHGNFLLAFVGAVALANVCFVIYQQSKFVPPKFPEARAFEGRASTPNPQPLADQSITFRVVGAPTMVGSIVLAVFDTPESFGNLQNARIVQAVPILDGVATWNIDPDQLPESLAILAFHDENHDELITENGFGVPIERYGYSGNQRFVAPNTPPTFETAVIERPTIGSTVDLFIR